MTEQNVGNLRERNPYPWRLFFLLLVGAVFGVLAVLPYLTVLLEPMLKSHPLRLPLPAIALIQGLVNFGIAIGLGLLIARRLGLGAPLLEGWLYKRRLVLSGRPFLVPGVTGIITGAVILALIHTPLGTALNNMPVVTEATIALWKRFLACFYGGLCEEMLMRLFLLSLVIWLLTLIWRHPSPSSASKVFWIANIFVALAFGAGHLPLAARLAPLTPALVMAVVLFNALAALPFGYLYWSRGLEAAMIAHFCTDIVLHVIGPTWS